MHIFNGQTVANAANGRLCPCLFVQPSLSKGPQTTLAMNLGRTEFHNPFKEIDEQVSLRVTFKDVEQPHASSPGAFVLFKVDLCPKNLNLFNISLDTKHRENQSSYLSFPLPCFTQQPTLPPHRLPTPPSPHTPASRTRRAKEQDRGRGPPRSPLSTP